MAMPPVVGHHAPAGQQKVDALCTVEGAAAAQRDQRIDRGRLRRLPPLPNLATVRILAEVVEWNDLHPRPAQQAGHPPDIAALNHAPISDEHDPAETKLPRQVANLPHHTGSVNQARQRMEVE